MVFIVEGDAVIKLAPLCLYGWPYLNCFVWAARGFLAKEIPPLFSLPDSQELCISFGRVP